MEAGELPVGWARASVCDVGTAVTGNTPSTQNPSNYGGQIPFVKPPQLNDLPIGATREFLSELGAQSARVLPPFSILVSCIGNLGKTGLNKAPVAFNQQINAIVPAGEISALFLFYQVQSHDFRSQLEAKATATTISIVNKGNFETTKLNIAPLAEQHRIVAKIEELFSELDQGVASLKTAREQLNVYRQSLLKNAFEGKLTAAWRAAHRDQLETATALQQRIARERQARYLQQLTDWQTAGQSGPKPKSPKSLPLLTAEELAELPELPAGWGWMKLGALIDDPAYGTSKKCDYEIAGVGVLRIPNVVSGKVDATDLKFAQFSSDEIASYQLAAGDLLIIRSNGSVSIVGKCALVSKQDTAYLYAGYLIRLRPLQPLVLPAYLAQLLSSHELRKQIEYKAKSTSGVNNINSGEIQALVVPFCGLTEQELILQELESKLSEADQLDQTLATALQQADALRQSILKKAFHGQLVKQAKNEEPATALLERIRAKRATSPTKGRQAKMVSKSLTNC
jgi:type I restriction enzyme S subunit